MIVKMKWRDPTIKWDRMDLDFQCKTYRAYGVLDRDGDDFIVHSMFTDALDDHDRVCVCRVPKGCVISITKMTEEREKLSWHPYTDEDTHDFPYVTN